jgi:hypothetical protein
MGKGNKHRGGRSRDDSDDRGSDKAFAQQQPFRSFGGGNQRHAATIGGTLGQAERHSEEHHGMITAMKDLRGRADGLEKKLMSTVPDYALYMKAKREMLDLERKLKASSPEFVEFQKLRVNIRTSSSKFDEAKARCKKCNFAKPDASPASATAAPAQPPLAMNPGSEATGGATQAQTA